MLKTQICVTRPQCVKWIQCCQHCVQDWYFPYQTDHFYDSETYNLTLIGVVTNTDVSAYSNLLTLHRGWSQRWEVCGDGEVHVHLATVYTLDIWIMPQFSPRTSLVGKTVWHTHTHTHTHTHARERVHTNARTHIRTYTYIYIHMCMYGTCDVCRLAQISLFEAVSMSDHRHRTIMWALHKMLSLNSTRFQTIVQSSFAYRAQLSTSHYFILRTNTDPVPDN